MHGPLLEAAEILVWDEATMSHRYLIEAIDRILQDIMKTDTILGGNLVILTRDFRQILPVVRRGRMAHIVDACMTKSPLWPHCIQLKLRTNMRMLMDIKTGHETERNRLENNADWRLKLGEGNVPYVDDTTFSDAIELPHEMCKLLKMTLSIVFTLICKII